MNDTKTDNVRTSTDELKDIQGGLIGFNKSHERLLFVNFNSPEAAKQFLGALTSQLANGLEVKKFNEAFSENRSHGGDPEALQSTWVNVWLSRTGLATLGATGLENFPPEFSGGMGARAQLVGDVGPSAPELWQGPFAGGAEPHAVILVAGDNLTDLDARRISIEALVSVHGAVIIGMQEGEARPSPFHGHEHFGFKDGVSQPGIEQLTKAGKGGIVPRGEVLVGYTDATGAVSGEAAGTPAPVPSAYDPTPQQPPSMPLPSWARNGSFVVYRKLRQDVAAFQSSMEAQASAIGLTPAQLAAKVVGRWPSGAPLVKVPGCPAHVDPTATDPSVEHPAILKEGNINAFDFSKDSEGTAVPRASHIRKMNPRADTLPDGDTATKHRMVRRGITYGPEFQPGETPYGQTVPDAQDRGLLFVNYQSSIARTFEFVQSRWANREDFQQAGDGKDPIISQDSPDGPFNIPGHGSVTFARWVVTVGGGYFFSPSISGLREICTPSNN